MLMVLSQHFEFGSGVRAGACGDVMVVIALLGNGATLAMTMLGTLVLVFMIVEELMVVVLNVVLVDCLRC